MGDTMGIGRDLVDIALVGGAVSSVRRAKQQGKAAPQGFSAEAAELIARRDALLISQAAQHQVVAHWAGAPAGYEDRVDAAVAAGGPPPEFYPDNADLRVVRYWDGLVWTGITKPAYCP